MNLSDIAGLRKRADILEQNVLKNGKISGPIDAKADVLHEVQKLHNRIARVERVSLGANGLDKNPDAIKKRLEVLEKRAGLAKQK